MIPKLIAALSIVTVLLVSGCSAGNLAEMYTEAAEAVDGVESTKLEYSGNIEGRLLYGTITINANTQEELLEIFDNVIHSIAKASGKRRSSLAITAKSTDGTLTAKTIDIGILETTPLMSEVREHYGL